MLDSTDDVILWIFPNFKNPSTMPEISACIFFMNQNSDTKNPFESIKLVLKWYKKPVHLSVYLNSLFKEVTYS